MNKCWPILYSRPVDSVDIRAQITPERAKELVREFERLFPEVSKWAEKVRDDVTANKQGDWAR